MRYVLRGKQRRKLLGANIHYKGETEEGARAKLAYVPQSANARRERRMDATRYEK